ncbi:MAG: HAD-IA family hydrolase, partial [Clostridiales bacterium]|nr:HAD-IA family hydrolase [Clostridiales bacterium]
PSKPAPDALNHLVEKHGLDRAVCVMVGDRAMDLDAGKSAGMATILLDPDGFYADYQPDHRFGDYASMHDALL